MNRFYPNADLAGLLYRDAVTRLADSLEYISTQLEASHTGVGNHGLAKHIGKIRDSDDPVSPAVFALYYDLIIAIEQGEPDRIPYILENFCLADDGPCSFAIHALDPADLGRDRFELYKKYSDCDIDLVLKLGRPDPAVFAQAKSRLEAGMSLLDKAVPELAAEIRSLIHEVIVAGQDLDEGDNADDHAFGGISSPYLWGAIFLSQDYSEGTVLQAAEGLIHEAAHMLLFAHSADGHLSLNPESQRLSSPLRNDPRPVEGIYHATFVLARMHYGIEAICKSGILDSGQLKEAQAMLAESTRLFRDGISTLDENAQLTATGQQLLADATEYMRNAKAA